MLETNKWARRLLSRQSMKKLFAPLSLVVSLSAIACTTSSTPTPAAVTGEECTDATKAGCVVRSAEQRLKTPNVPTSDMESLVSGNTEFAANMYQQLRGEPGNFFYSPHSISSALGMTWAGAKGQTEADMATALSFKLSQAKYHPAMNQLDLELMSRGQGAQGADGGGFRLNIANALWGQVGYHFEGQFLDTLAVNYDAGMHIVDYINQAPQAIDLINGWVEKKTEDRIKDILSPGSVDGSTRLVLTNAVYFNAAWEAPFEPANTAPGAFTTQEGSSVMVPMMHGSFNVPYAQTTEYTAVELPYDGHELSMVLVLPTDLNAFESTLTGAELEKVASSLSSGYMVDTKMPTFEFESKFGLVPPLQALGMGIAFTDAADFSAINGTGGLLITDVIHQSFVKVNEAGTEAAAATAVIVGETSLPQPAAITLDKPFVFFIRDLQTKAVLFVGRVADPS
jgi:serpin B